MKTGVKSSYWQDDTTGVISGLLCLETQSPHHLKIYTHTMIYIYCCLVTKPCLTLCDPWTVVHQTPMPSNISLSWLKFTSIVSVILSNHLIPCHPLLLLPSIFPSIRVFSNEFGSLHQVAKVLELQLQHQFNEYSGLISFRIDWFDLFAVQGALKSLLQHQFESISSSALCLLYGPTLTSIHDYWKNYSFECTDLCQQSDVCFLIHCLGFL